MRVQDAYRLLRQSRSTEVNEIHGRDSQRRGTTAAENGNDSRSTSATSQRVSENESVHSEPWMDQRIDELYDELEGLRLEKKNLVRDQRLLARKWETAVDPDAAEWEERAWMRDDNTLGVLSETEDAVRAIEEGVVQLEAELAILEEILDG